MGSDAEAEGREGLALVGEIAAEVAHELRNVLQIVASNAFVARRELSAGNGTSALPHVVQIERSARVAQGIVDDVLSLSQSDALRCEPTPWSEVLEAARLDPALAAAHWIDVAAPSLEVRVHRGLFARLLHALYENAVRACAPRDAALTTTANVMDGRLIVEVTDEGPGVPAEVAPRVFDPFVSGRPGGTGLGLSLAKRIAQAHGGSIALVPSASGAAFRVELPNVG